VHVWTEQIDAFSLDTIVWPRASAAGEILWTGKNQTQTRAAMRLSEFRERMVHRGVMAENIQMPFCTQDIKHCQA
jgi:hexosaminidase